MVTVCVVEVDCGEQRLVPEDAEALRDLGLSESFYAGFFTALLSVFALSFTLVAVLIFWRRSNDWMAMLVSVALVSFGTSWTDVPDSLVTANPEWRFAGTFVFALGLTTLFLLFYLFPDGRFVPRWTRFAAFLWIAVSVALFVDSVLAQEIYGEGPAGQGAIGSLLLVVTVVVVLIGVYAQIYRYTRHSTPVQRQQSKWVMVGLTTAVLLGAVGISLGETVLSSPGMPDGRIGLVVGDVTDKGVPAALVMATTRAILRAAAEQLISPGEVLQRANDVLCPDHTSENVRHLSLRGPRSRARPASVRQRGTGPAMPHELRRHTGAAGHGNAPGPDARHDI